MSRKSRLTITFFAVISTFSPMLDAGNPIIGGYLVPAPQEVIQPLNLPTPVVGGIKITYSGYSDYTNRDGYFSFPKHHTDPEIRLIVCAETDYDLLKETVSKVKINSKAQNPAIAVYRITKQKETFSEDVNAQGIGKKDQTQKAAPETPGDADKAKDANKDADPSKKTDTPNNNEVWCYTIKAEGNLAPTDGIRSTDVIIHCDPAMIYLKDKSYYYASTEETSHFILPTECIFLLKTPAAPDLDRADIMTESIESEIQVENVENKSSETDSMGNPLPGVVRSARSNTQ